MAPSQSAGAYELRNDDPVGFWREAEHGIRHEGLRK
jgi:hypothetical protein